MVFVMSLGYFVTPALLGGTANMMLAELIAQLVQSLLNWGLGGAAAFVLLVVTLAIYALQLRYFGARRAGAGGHLRCCSTSTAWAACAGCLARHRRARRRLPPPADRVHRRCSRSARRSWLIFPPPGWTLRWYQELFADPRWLDAVLTSARDRRAGHDRSRSCLGLLASLRPRRAAGSAGARCAARLLPDADGPAGRRPRRRPLRGLPAARPQRHPHRLRHRPHGARAALRDHPDQPTRSRASTSRSRTRRSLCGASPLRGEAAGHACRRIRLGLFAAAIFSFLASWDEVVLAIFMASPTLQTLPV